MSGADILLVEDDEVLCEIVERNLRARGHSVRVEHDMHSALASLRSHHFDLVVLDINLPDQTGWEMLREAMQEGTLHPLAYLPKPFPLDSLLRLAAEAAQRKAGSAANEQQETECSLSTLSDEEDLYA